jgi:hypothetical protein
MEGGRKPWDQLPNEPDAAFVRFLFYRSLGPARSLLKAHLAMMGELGEGPERPEKAHAPGQWHKDCRLYNWPERAQAWDVHTFATVGRDAVIALVGYIRKLAVKGLGLVDTSPGPETWKEHLETVHALANLIPPETISGLLNLGHAEGEQSKRDGDAAPTGEPGGVPGQPRPVRGEGAGGEVVEEAGGSGAGGP